MRCSVCGKHIHPYATHRCPTKASPGGVITIRFDYTVDQIRQLIRRGNTMSNDSRKADLAAKISVLLDQIVGLSKYPDEDPFHEGDVIWFQKKFPNDGDQLFSYAAIKVEDGWYTTAAKTPCYFSSWTNLCNWMGGGVRKIYLMHRGECIIDTQATRAEFLAELRSQITDPDVNWNEGRY